MLRRQKHVLSQSTTPFACTVVVSYLALQPCISFVSGLGWLFPPSASACVFDRCFSLPQRAFFPWESLHQTLINTALCVQLSHFEFLHAHALLPDPVSATKLTFKSGVAPANQTKKGQFMNFSQGHSGTKVQCESCLFS